MLRLMKRALPTCGQVNNAHLNLSLFAESEEVKSFLGKNILFIAHIEKESHSHFPT
jgi:hypothetical protein